jgi:hypothetical protein
MRRGEGSGNAEVGMGSGRMDGREAVGRTTGRVEDDGRV